MVEVPEFTLEMAQLMKIFEGDKFPVKGFVMAFNLAPATQVIGSPEDRFDTVFLRFRFEDFSDKLFCIIEINFTRESSGAEGPAKSVDR